MPGVPRGESDQKRFQAVVDAQRRLEEAKRERNKALADSVCFVNQGELCDLLGVSMTSLWRYLQKGKRGE